MKRHLHHHFHWYCRLGMVLSLILFSACASKPKNEIDWASRVGVYTFDQAVLEYGPVDKQAKLQDGTTVAEWVTKQGYSHTYVTPGYYYAGPRGYYEPPTYNETRVPDHILRLTFGPDGRLTAWKNVIR